MYFPSLDQSLGYLLNSSVTMLFSSWAPSAFLIKRSWLGPRFEPNTNRAPSGLQTGKASIDGSKVSRFDLSRCSSYVQTVHVQAFHVGLINCHRSLIQCQKYIAVHRRSADYTRCLPFTIEPRRL